MNAQKGCERSTERSFETQSITEENCGQQSQYLNTKESSPLSAFQLLGKLKAVINEVALALENPAKALSVDDCISITEEGLRAFKTIKVGRRIDGRRQLNLNSSRLSGASPTNREVGDGDHAESDAALSSRRQHLCSPNSKKVSPKRMESEYQRRDGIEAARQASALRSEERQRKAEERRLEKLQEMKSKLVAAGERSFQAKQRRTQAEERLRNDTLERHENGARRVEEAREQTKERARRGHSRVEEVRLNYELRNQTKALLLDRKMSEVEHNQEQKREELQRHAQERNEAMLAVAERRRNLSQERIERQQQREQQRRENLRRHEEQKKLEKDLKEQRAEEWEKKVQQRQRDACAEAEARGRKVEERIQQSVQLREEKREMLRQKLEKQEQKIKEARQRKEREADTKPTIKELMPFISPQEEEQLAQKLAKVVAVTARQGKSYMEIYQKESTMSAKDLNRSKLRSIISRLGSNTSSASLVQCRQSLHDLLGMTEFADVDHEYVRYFNSYESFARVLMDSRRKSDMVTFRLAHNALIRFLTDANEGKKHVLMFIRSGNLAPLLLCIRDEIKDLKRHSHSIPLAASLEILQLCFERIAIDAQTNVKLITVRDQLLADLDAAGIDRYCVAVTRAFTEEEDLKVVYSATRLIHSQVSILSKKKGDFPTVWFRQVACAFFTLLENILTPDGCPLSATGTLLSARRITIIFIVFRVLNSLARWRLDLLQELLHDASIDKGGSNIHVDPKVVSEKTPNVITLTEIFHVLSGFFTYVQTHADLLETIPGENTVDEGVRGSFESALKFGVTLAQIPPLPASQPSNSSTAGLTMTPARPPYYLRAALHECLLLIGYLCVQDKQIQGMFAWGKGKSLLSRILSALPLQYFTSACHILYPTLLAIIVNMEDNLTFAKREMDIKPLLKLLEEEYQALPKKAKLYALQRHAELNPVTKEDQDEPDQPVRWVDLLGGDDDEFFIQLRQAAAPAPAPAPAPTTLPLSTPEKEKLYRQLKNPGLTPSGYFKIERRLPLALWPAVMEQLTRAVHETNKGE
ncbi:hypothetical protein TCSYLVIO_007206 [Trypanosoma cruzi]|uniref:Uncharacterized protein n=2 Tax=Trypanosoma cruzi TaxID=5693 RepID=V5AY62_TRYCR|nr:hypothetical protein TCSYLVIO_007206 [Trypanosoma cruzi]ESS65815.1 hypothetical protein TCDM_05642 [Trypanosoma cruzi Dm28c]KAF8283432.1 hypothetical protein TcBrA4_0055360 [Trypanosoma cruzi]RNF20442.1 hypothetical protein TcG_03689 [Trypanosoma cruzi]